MIADSKKKIFYKALFITFLVMFLSLLFASLIVNWSETDIDKVYNDIVQDTQEIQLYSTFFNTFNLDKNSCSLMDKQIRVYSDKVYELSRNVNYYYEQNNGSDKAKEIQKNAVYANLELWLKAENYSKICDTNNNYLLYFYPYDCVECGPLVDTINEYKKQYKEDLWIFSIPGNADSDFINFLQKYYNIDYLPSVIINGNVIKGPESYKEIEKYLK